jgi:hypothetical protein
VGALAISVAVAFVGLRGGDDTSSEAAGARPAGEPSTAETHPQTIAIDAMPSTVRHVAPDDGGVASIATTAPDAAVSDAPSVAEAIDAAISPPDRSKTGAQGPHQPNRRGTHAGSTGSTTHRLIDRGD